MAFGFAYAAVEAARRVVAEWAVDHPRQPPGACPSWLEDGPGMRRGGAGPRAATSGAAGPLWRTLRQLRARRLGAVECVRAAIACAEAHADLHGMAYLDAGAALEEARRLESVCPDPAAMPLYGIPVSVKDVIHVRGMPTRCGSEAYHCTPASDAASVARLRAAGAIVVGKATSHEFALGVTTPQARNPHDPTRIPGGSSGGSAIGVAVGAVLGSLGTDTRASIRNPAALSGVVGFKPTFGTVPTGGVVPLSWSMDHVGPIAASVADAALLLDVLQGAAGSDRTLVGCVGAPVRGLRLGVPEVAFTACDPEVAAAVRAAIGRLEDLGVAVEPLARPDDADLDLANAAGLLVSRCEAACFHRRIGTDRERLWRETREQLEAALEVPAHEYLTALSARGWLAGDLTGLLARVDAVALPTCSLAAPRVEEAEHYLTELSRQCIPWSFVGLPALSVPCRDRAGGLPVGLQLVAGPHREGVLVALGSAYEASLA